jgi:integrase
MLAAKGMSLDAISARLGHEDSRITKAIYLHRMEELKKKENEQLDKLTLLG